MGNPYDSINLDTPNDSKAGNPYDAIPLSSPTQFRASIVPAMDHNPGDTARALRLADQYGVPVAAVQANLAEVERRAKLDDYERMLSDAPRTRDFLALPDNAGVAHDDIRQLSRFEKLFRGLSAGAWGAVGSGFSGLGDGVDALMRRVVGLGAKLGFDDFVAAEQSPDANTARTTPYGDILRSIGKPAKRIERTIDVPAGQKDFADEVTNGLGQVLAQLPMSLTGPGGLALLFGQGVDQQSGRSAKDDAPQWKKDVSMLGAGAWTAVTEKYALDHWTKLSPLSSLKNPIAARAAGVGIASASEGGQEWLENVGHDFLRQQLTKPEAGIDWGDAAHAGGVGAAVGGIVRTMIESALHIKARRSQQFFEDLGDAAKSSELGKRAPDVLSQFIAESAKGGPVENVFIPAQAFQTYFQSIGVDPEAAATLAGVTNYAEAVKAGTDMVIPIGDFTAKVAGTDHLPALMPDLRLHQGDMTAREVAEYAANKEARDQYLQQQYEQLLAEGESARGINTAIDRVVTDVEGQLISSGVERSTAKTQAQVMRGVAVLAQRAFPNMEPVQAAEKLWDQYGLTVQRDLPPILTHLKNSDVQLDPLLDRLRAGAIPKEQEAFGQPLHEFIRAMGGVQDQGGELSARDADVGNAPFVKNLIQQLGLDFDGARELASQHGFPVGETEADFISALTGSLEGNPIYSPNQENPAAIGMMQTLGDLDRALKDSGIDLNAVDNATARKMLEQAGEVTGARYDQAVDAKTRLDAMLSRDPVHVELGELEGKHGKELRDEARKLYPENDTETNPISHETVKFVVKGYREMKSHSGDERVMQIVPSLKELFRQATPLSIAADEGHHPDVAEWHYYGVRAEIAGDQVVVHLAARKMNDGRVELMYYDANVRDLADVEKVMAGGLSTTMQSHPSATTGNLSASKDRLLQWVSDVKDGSILYQSSGTGLADVRKTWSDAGIKHAISENNGTITVSQIVVPENERGSGKGTAAMQALIDYADRTGQHIVLSPSSDFGGNKKRLVQFYKRFGFIENKGKNRAFSTSESMYRQADGKVLYQNQSDKKRGFLEIGNDRKMRIGLTENANLSTFLHETGHFYLEMMGDLAANPDAAQQVKDDYAAILSWMGVTDRSQITVEQHEKFARANEAYLREGKAPAPALQGAFQRFKAWLSYIYRSLSKLDVTLSDEVRGVFDRIYATDSEIDAASDRVDVSPLFLTAEAMGMSPEEFALYRERVGKVSAEAQEALLAKLMREYLRGQKQWWQDERVKVKEDVTAEVDAQPVYRAFSALVAGEYNGQPFKLDKADLVSRYGEPYLKNLPKGFGRVYTLEGGLDADTVAEVFGFGNGHELVQALMEMRNRRELIEAETDVRMRERHGDMMTDGTMAEAAVSALHNEERASVLAVELRALMKQAAMTGTAPNLHAFKEAALGRIEQMALRDIQPHSYLIAGKKAAREAFNALAAQDYGAAVQAKHREILNHYLYLEATRAKADFAKIDARFKKMVAGKDAGLAKSRDMDVVMAARAILADFGYGGKAKKAGEYLEKVKQYDPAMYAVLADRVAAADELAASLPQTERGPQLRDLTTLQARALADEVEALWFLAKRNRQMEIDGDLIDRQEVAEQLVARLEEIGLPESMPGETSAITPAEQRAQKLATAIAWQRRVESWVDRVDGNNAMGPFRRFIWNPIKEAADLYRTEKAKVLKSFRGLFDAIEPTMKKGLIEAPELGAKGYTFGHDTGGVGMNELLHALLHIGNDSNKRKLLLGRGWASERADGTLDTSRWDAFVKRLVDEGRLTRAHFDFVQGVWDLLESLKPAAQKAHREAYGRYFDEVTANGFSVTLPDGGVVNYRGGYAPAMVDSRIVKDMELKKLIEEGKDGIAYAFPGTSKGFTQARVEYNRPLMLDLRTLAQHIDKVLLFSHMESPVRDAGKLLHSGELSGALNRADGGAISGMLLPWLNRAATQRVTTPISGDAGLSRFFGVLRSRTGMAAMFANVSNALQQVTGFMLASLKVKNGLMLDATAQWFKSPKQMTSNVAALSPYMAARMENEVAAMQGDIEVILIDPTLLDRAQDWTNRHAYFLQSAVDNVMGPIIWTAAYNQAMEEGHSEKDARRLADAAIRQTQGSTLPEDISRLETGPTYARLFSQFYGYFNMQANLLGTEFAKVAQEMGLKKGMGRGFYILLAGFIAPAIVAEAIAQAFKGGPGDDDKDGQYLDDWLMALLVYGPIRNMTAFIPFAGQAVNSAVARFNGNPNDDKMSVSPAVGAIESVAGVPYDLYKMAKGEGNAQRTVKDVASLISMTVGVPASAVARPLGYMAGVEQGKVRPTSGADAARGLIAGSASPESRSR